MACINPCNNNNDDDDDDNNDNNNNNNNNNRNKCNVRNHCHYTGKYKADTLYI